MKKYMAYIGYERDKEEETKIKYGVSLFNSEGVRVYNKCKQAEEDITEEGKYYNYLHAVYWGVSKLSKYIDEEVDSECKLNIYVTSRNFLKWLESGEIPEKYSEILDEIKFEMSFYKIKEIEVVYTGQDRVKYEEEAKEKVVNVMDMFA